jgi:uncharacterized protein (TIGR01777 family)
MGQDHKTVLIAGATGFLGGMLTPFLVRQGYRVIGLSRRQNIIQDDGTHTGEIHRWNSSALDGWEKRLEPADFIINLAGENISAFRWTAKKKERIHHSRLQASKTLMQAIGKQKSRPRLFIQVSGIHFYGSRGDTTIDENEPGGLGFLAGVAQDSENLTADIESLGIRRVVLRLGMVLSLQGGALPRLLLPFRLFVGGRMGDGQQWIPWIHAIDFCRAMEFFLTQENISGPVNLVSPQPVQNCELTRVVAQTLKRPALMPLPGWIITIFLGEMGRELLLSSQRALPKKLTACGFDFQFPDFAAALHHLTAR